MVVNEPARLVKWLQGSLRMALSHVERTMPGLQTYRLANVVVAKPYFASTPMGPPSAASCTQGSVPVRLAKWRQASMALERSHALRIAKA